MPLVIHFLNVGHGDCTIIEHPDGEYTVIDINNGGDLDADSRREIDAAFPPPRAPQLGLNLADVARPPHPGLGLAGLGMRPQPGLGLFGQPARLGLAPPAVPKYDVQLTDPIKFISTRYRRRPFRYIQTHPDLDHMRGLAGLVAAGYTPVNFWDGAHAKQPDLQARDVADWKAYIALRNGSHGNSVLQLHRGAEGRFYNRNAHDAPGGHGIEILSPFKELVTWANDNENWNELSYVLRVRHAGKSIILGGDAEETAWTYILRNYGGENLKCDVLKASHHGRDSGYHQEAVKAMSPLATVVSVGKKPETDASNKYRSHSPNVWSTRWKGTISLTITDTGAIQYSTEYDR